LVSGLNDIICRTSNKPVGASTFGTVSVSSCGGANSLFGADLPGTGASDRACSKSCVDIVTSLPPHEARGTSLPPHEARGASLPPHKARGACPRTGAGMGPCGPPPRERSRRSSPTRPTHQGPIQAPPKAPTFTSCCAWRERSTYAERTFPMTGRPPTRPPSWCSEFSTRTPRRRRRRPRSRCTSVLGRGRPRGLRRVRGCA